MKLLIFSFLLFSLIYPTTGVASDINSIMETARKDAKNLVIPENLNTEKGQDAAKESAKLYHSPTYQEQLHNDEQRLTSEVFKNFIHPWKKNPSSQSHPDNSPDLSSENEKIYLLFSSSVPIETMRAYFNDIARANLSEILPVMRGWVGGLTETIRDVDYFSQLLQKDATCMGEQQPCDFHKIEISLNPEIFKKYTITKVPAVLYVKDKSPITLYGDASLLYHLERIHREVPSPTLRKMIERLKSNVHE